jgi:hypothetical protein
VGDDREKFPAEFEAFARGWDVSDPQFAAFKQFAADKKAKLTVAQMDGEEPYIRRRLKAEVASNLYGLVARYRIDSEGDGQLQKALDLFPQARKILAVSTDGVKKKI